MAYGLKYYKEFAWTNYANDTTGNTRIEILENNYSGSSVEIDELGETPVQLRLDNTGDMINQTIKKTSLVLSIIDTDQFDYSQFYTSDGKKYKVNLISSVSNWTGYLVPQSFGQELGTNGLISITASDGLHLLQGIDYVADKNKTLKLADFIADIETKIGLGTFDRSVSLATDKGDLWQQFIYEGMFLDKNYEDCLDMVLTAYGLQVRYWKLFPVTSILSHSFSGSVKCLDNVPMVDYLPIAKKLKINQNLTTLPDILEDAMVDDATDVIQRTPAYWKLAKWVTVSDNGLPVYPYKDRQASENMYKSISMYAIPTNAPYDTQRITGHEGSKYVLREFDSTPFQIEFNANFGRLSVYGRSSETGYQEKLRPISWSQLHWGLYDTKTNKSFSKATNSWSITGRPTYSTANIIRVDNPADSDVTVYINVPKTTGDVLGLELFLFTPSFAYNNPAAEATNGIFSINSIKIAEIGGVSENELYNEIKGTITVGDNIDVIEYDYELGTSPSYPTNTSLYYGSSLYNNIYDQITSFTLAGNSVNQMQYLANTILYSNGAGRKSVFSGTFAPMNNGNLMFYRANVNNVNCLINSFTLDVRRVKFVDAEFVEIAPFTFTNYTITSESSIGSSDWGGSGGSSGTVGGGGGSVDTSNFVVKTGAVTQNIEGSVTVEGAVVAGALNGTLPDDLPVATSLLYGTIKFDPTTLALNGSNQLTVIGGGWSNVAWGNPTSQYSPLTINSVTRNLSVDGHTHNYLPLSGGILTGDLRINARVFINSDSHHLFYNSAIGCISSKYGFAVGDNYVWHAGNFNPSSYLPLSGGTLSGAFEVSAPIYTTEWFRNKTSGCGLYNEAEQAHWYAANGYWNASKEILINSNKVWHAGNDGAGSGLDADLLDGVQLSTIRQSNIYSLGNYYGEGTTVENCKQWIVDRFNSVASLGVGTNVIVGRSYIDQWDNNQGTYYPSSLYSMIKISGGYEDMWYGQFLLSSYDLNNIGVVGRTGNNWTSTKWLAFTTDNVASATKLANTRTIWGQNFNGEGNVSGALSGATTGTFSSYLTANRFYTGYDSGQANAISCSNWFRSNGATGWLNATYSAGILSDTDNTVRTYNTNKFKVYNTAIDSILTLGGVTAANVISSGAVVAGATNGVLPDDLPVATDSLYGVVKIDGVTIKIDANGKIYAIATGGISSWNDLTDKPANLTALAALTGAGIVRRNSDGTFTLDTSAYLTAITKAMVEAVLTGTITSHTHSQYLTAITKGMVEAVLTGNITSHTHSQYLLATAYTAADVLSKMLTVDGAGSGLDADLLDGVHEKDLARGGYRRYNFNGNGWKRIAIISSTEMGTQTGTFYINNEYWHHNGSPIILNFGVQYRGVVFLNQLGGYPGTITQSRLVYNPNADGETYFEVYYNGGVANAMYISHVGVPLYNLYDVETAGTVPSGYTSYDLTLGDNNLTGNASSATKLANTRTIWGQNFNGEGNVSGALSGATTGAFSSYLTANRFYTGYDSMISNSISCSNWFRSNGESGWFNDSKGAGIYSDTANVVRTYSTNKFKVYNTESDSILTLGGVTAANVISSGAVVAGALNGTLPDDLPVATSSLFGVIKTGLSLNNNAGVVNINGRHYTTTSTYTDSAVREITAEIALGTGSMANGTLDQIELSFAPLTTTRGLTANVIATNTGAGMGLKLGFRKDTGSGRWYIMIYNDSGAAVTRDGILLSIRGQQTI